MGAEVGSAFFSLRALGEKLGVDIDRAMKKAGARMKRAAAAIGKGIAAGLTAGIAAMTAATVLAFRSIDRLAKESDKLGIPVQKLQALQHAAALTGVEATKLGTGLQRMTRRVAEAAIGTGEAVGALKELRLDAAELVRLSPDQIFARIGEAMRGVGSQADRVRLAMKLFDSEGVGLVNTLALTERQLNAIEKDLKDFGVTIDRNAAKSVERANDQFTRLGAVLKGFGNQLAVSVAPLVEVVTDKFIEWARQTSFLTGKFDGMVRVIGETLDIIAGYPILLNEAALGFLKLQRIINLTNPDKFVQLTAAIVKLTAKNDELKAGVLFGDSVSQKIIDARKKAAKSIQDSLLEGQGNIQETLEDELRGYITTLKASNDPMERYRKRIAEITEGINAGAIPATAELKTLLGELNDLVQANQEQTVESVRAMTEEWASFASNSLRAIDEFVETGRLSIKAFARDVIQDLAKIQIKNILFGGGGLFGGGIFGSIGSALGLTNVPVKGAAIGANLAAGEPRIVGEQGPELFQPSVPGDIIPTNATRRMLRQNSGGKSVVVNNNFATGVSRRELDGILVKWQQETINSISLGVQSGGQFGQIFNPSRA